MHYVGLDIHARHVSFTVLDGKGGLVERGRTRSVAETCPLLKRLSGRVEVCYEASCGYGHTYDLLKSLVDRVAVAHPGHLRLIYRSKSKNDRNDADRLAKLLYLGEVPEVHVPSLEVRAWRELINARSHLIDKRTRAKCALRSLLRSAGEAPPRSPNLWTKTGLRWLRLIDLPTASQNLRRDLLLEEIEAFSRQALRIEQELNRRAQQAPAVERLQTIPGVGARTAEAMVAFLDDPNRFPNAKAVGQYFGLVPWQDQSGDKNRLGHITREGPSVVRRLIAEAAWQARRRSPTVGAFYARTQRADPQRKKIALVATAHYLVRVMWAMLKRETVWRESVPLAG